MTPFVLAAGSVLSLGGAAGAGEHAGGAEKLRLVSVTASPDPFSPPVKGTVSIQGDFESRPTDAGAGNDRSGKTFAVRMTVTITDSAGQPVRELSDEFSFSYPDDLPASRYYPVTCTISWDGRDSSGAVVADGSYTYNVRGTLVRYDVLGNGKTQEHIVGSSAAVSGTVAVDSTPPVIERLLPPDVVYEARPEVRIRATDALSGVRPDSVRMTLDEQSAQLVEIEPGVYSFVPGYDLDSGGHTVVFRAGDFAGNADTLTFDFTVILDSDGDGLLDTEEWELGTDPYNPDTDWDGLTDGDEVLYYGTDPLECDTDGDWLSDYEELWSYYTDPLDYDSDDDGLSDYEELSWYYTDPLDYDSDDDMLSDYEEVVLYFTDPWNPDTDGDGMLDGEDPDPLVYALTVELFPDIDQLPDGRYVTNHPFSIQVTVEGSPVTPGAYSLTLSGADSWWLDDNRGMGPLTFRDVSFTTDGEYDIVVSASDDATAYGEGTVTVVWDTTPPVITITKIADPLVTFPEDLLSPPFGFLWLNNDMDNVARNVYNAAMFNVEFKADDLTGPVVRAAYGLYNIGAHHDAVAVPYGNDMARDYEYPYPKDNDIIRLGEIAHGDPPEILPLEPAPGTGAVLAQSEAWRWDWDRCWPVGGGSFIVPQGTFEDVYDTQLLLVQATDLAGNTGRTFMVFAADLWEDQFFSIPKFWSYSHFPHMVSLPYDARDVSLGGGSLTRLSYNYIEEEVNYSLWGLPMSVAPPGWMSWNNKWDIGDVLMEDFAGNTGIEKLEVFRWSWSILSLPKVPWYALQNEKAYYMLPAGGNEWARCIAGDERERVFQIEALHHDYTYKDIYENDHTFKYFGYKIDYEKVKPPLWLLPRQGEDLQPRLNGVGLSFLRMPPGAQVSVTPYLKTLKASAGIVAADKTVSFTGWQGDYPGERWLQHAGWTELTLSFSGTDSATGRSIAGTTFHPWTVNLVRVVPSVAATGSTVTLRIRAANLGDQWDPVLVWFYKDGVDVTWELNPSIPVVVHDDTLNTDIVQAIEVEIEIPADDEYLGLYDIEIMTPWMDATMPGLPAFPGPLDTLQPYAGYQGGVMLPEVLEVVKLEFKALYLSDEGPVTLRVETIDDFELLRLSSGIGPTDVGILFFGAATIPPQSKGTLQFVQNINGYAEILFEDGSRLRWSTKGQYYLDEKDPYAEGRQPIPGELGPHYYLLAADTPSIAMVTKYGSLNLGQLCKGMVINEQFKMYLLFESSRGNRTTLGLGTWTWSAEVDRGPDGRFRLRSWTFPDAPDGTASTEVPKLEPNADDIEFEAIGGGDALELLPFYEYLRKQAK